MMTLERNSHRSEGGGGVPAMTARPAALRPRRRSGLPLAILALAVTGAITGSAGAAPRTGAGAAAPSMVSVCGAHGAARL